MNNNIQTILSILLIIIGIIYPIIYFQKKKNGTHKDVTYKIIFLIVLLLIAVPLLSSIF